MLTWYDSPIADHFTNRRVQLCGHFFLEERFLYFCIDYVSQSVFQMRCIEFCPAIFILTFRHYLTPSPTSWRQWNDSNFANRKAFRLCVFEADLTQLASSWRLSLGHQNFKEWYFGLAPRSDVESDLSIDNPNKDRDLPSGHLATSSGTSSFQHWMYQLLQLLLVLTVMISTSLSWFPTMTSQFAARWKTRRLVQHLTLVHLRRLQLLTRWWDQVNVIIGR